jgi:16S rRNA (uracil1498-N3)-methyltransferase
VVEAAKQAKRYYIPTVDPPIQFQQVISVPAATKIMFAERGGGPLKSALVGSPVLYLIGPEGGWTDAEMESAQLRGFHFISLGTGIMKAETAAIAGGAILHYELGKTNAFQS